ncbi:MAG: efflux RND transporter periplasmic adaptor subunit [Candidatus Eisenbacteria bacterium]
MDIPIQKKPKRHWPHYSVVAAGLLLGTLGLLRLQPAGPTIERATLLVDTVRRGEMRRDVRGNGTLVPEDLRIVSALTAGRIERIVARPGTAVEPGSVLLEMSNPDVQLEALDAERQLTLAEAELATLRASLETQRLAAVSSLATARTELREAERQVRVAERLATDGLSSGMDVERARDRVAEARERHESEQRRLVVVEEATRAQLELRRSEVARLASIAAFQRDRVSSMQVRAGQKGLVQSLSLQPGQWVNPGQELARVAGRDRLKAVLQVPESQARDLALGLHAAVDTRDGIVAGHVSRVDPAVQGGTVAVDVTLEGALPRAARPDLSVDGTIEIDRIANALFVGRPAEASTESATTLFRLDAGGRTATRVKVRLGRGAADAVEILEGLKEGDRVILSEMSQWNTHDRVTLK